MPNDIVYQQIKWWHAVWQDHTNAERAYHRVTDNQSCSSLSSARGIFVRTRKATNAARRIAVRIQLCTALFCNSLEVLEL